MNPGLLLTHFNRISEARDAVPRLRRFILDLAVRGKLVETDPTDESASELLNRIRAEKARLVEQGVIPKQKPLPPIETDEAPFNLPSNWRWVRLNEITSYIQRGKSPKYASDDGLPVISQKCVQWRGLEFESAKRITRESIESYEDIRFLRDGDLLWNSTGTGTIGRIVRVTVPPSKLICDSHVTVVRCLQVDAEYVRSWLRSDNVYGSIEDRAAGSTNQVELTSQMAISQIVPLPPIAEQRRIVAKVDELMALCDRLEATQGEREMRRNRLAGATHYFLNNGSNVDAIRKHADFFFSHLPCLTTCQDHVQQLRQSIRNLAIRGRLVRQDPTDVSASQVVREISQNKERLYAAKKIPKPTQLPIISESDMPFTTPSGWCWTMLGDLCYQVSDGPHFSPKYVGPHEGVPFLSTRNVRPGSFDLSSVKYISHKDHETFSKRIRPGKGDILYTKGGTTGLAKVNDLDFEFSVWVHLAVLRIDGERLLPRYVELALNSPHCYAQSQRYTQGISNFDLGLTRMVKITIPLPPLAEQHRIVAKADELMALCDRLEAQLATVQNETSRLLESVLHYALNDSHRDLAGVYCAP
jgi:type I restriction enzyme S subunit